jgi:hypothetical protein
MDLKQIHIYNASFLCHLYYLSEDAALNVKNGNTVFKIISLDRSPILFAYFQTVVYSIINHYNQVGCNAFDTL